MRFVVYVCDRDSYRTFFFSFMWMETEKKE